MSDTVNPAPASAVVNAVVQQAQNLPQLVAGLEVAAPALASALTNATVSVHAAPWGGAAVALVSLLATKFGLGWSADFDAAVVGGAFLVGNYLVPKILSLWKKV